MSTETIRDHPGTSNNPDGLATLLAKLEAAADMRGVFAAVPAFARLDLGDREYALAWLKNRYRRKFQLRALRHAIKDERQRQLQARRQARWKARQEVAQ